MSYFKAEMHQIVFDRGSAPDPAGGVYDAPPDRLVGCEAGAPHFPPLDAFGVSVSAPLASKLVYPRLCFFSNSTPGVKHDTE